MPDIQSHQTTRLRGQLEIAGKLALLVLAYYLGGRLGLAIPYFGSHITLIWLPTGIAVAALQRWGRGYWPGVYVGAFLVNLSIGSSSPLAAGIAVGNTLGPLAAVWLLHRFGFHTDFGRRRDITHFSGAAAVGMLVSATGGTLSLCLAGLAPWGAFASAWTTWWLGDTVGVLLAGPLLLTLNRAGLAEIDQRRSEFAAWCGTTVAVSSAVFIFNSAGLPMAFIPLPLIAWVALRFGITGSSFGVLLLATMAAWGTSTGRGPFHLHDMVHGLLLLWAFMVTMVLMGLLIAALQAERRQMEKALRQLNESLEQRVSDEVAKNREKDALLMQQSRLAAMGEMVSNIAHQWRQPLNAVNLILANLQDAHRYGELDDAALKRAMEDGNRVIQQMSRTIDDFRNFFQPNKEKAPFLLREAVREALSLVEAGFRYQGIDFVMEGDENLRVLGHGNEYAQVLLNLLNNAREAIMERGIRNGRVVIRLEREGDDAKVTVSDNGGGIPLDVLPRVFDPYFSTKRTGTGIGLYMSKMIIEKSMNGRIEVANGEGGAEFSIICPLWQDSPHLG